MDKTDLRTDEEKAIAQKKALGQIKAVFEDGVATINGRDYVFTKATHKKRLKVFSYFTGIKGMIEKQDFSFMGNDDFDAVMDIIENLVTFDNSLLSKRPQHWDEYPQDYMMFVTTALGVISYPFLQGGH